jgi:phosphate:Na+ symporter
MSQEDNNQIYELKLTARKIIEMVKDVRELQKNLNFFTTGNNTFMLDEYNKLRTQLVTVLRVIQEVRDYEGEEDIMTRIEVQKEKIKENEMVLNKNIDTMIRENKIDSKMASSLMNDVGFTFSICKKLLASAITLWVQQEEIKELGDEYEY